MALHNEFGSHNFDEILKEIIINGKVLKDEEDDDDDGSNGDSLIANGH